MHLGKFDCTPKLNWIKLSLSLGLTLEPARGAITRTTPWPCLEESSSTSNNQLAASFSLCTTMRNTDRSFPLSKATRHAIAFPSTTESKFRDQPFLCCVQYRDWPRQWLVVIGRMSLATLQDGKTTERRNFVVSTYLNSPQNQLWQRKGVIQLAVVYFHYPPLAIQKTELLPKSFWKVDVTFETERQKPGKSSD